MFKTEDSVAGFDLDVMQTLMVVMRAYLYQMSQCSTTFENSQGTRICVRTVVCTPNSTVDVIQQQTHLYSSFVDIKNGLNTKGAPISE